METLVIVLGTVLAIVIIIAIGAGMVMVLRERMIVENRIDAVTR